jgi:hypothetical protein
MPSTHVTRAPDSATETKRSLSVSVPRTRSAAICRPSSQCGDSGTPRIRTPSIHISENPLGTDPIRWTDSTALAAPTSGPACPADCCAGHSIELCGSCCAQCTSQPIHRSSAGSSTQVHSSLLHAHLHEIASGLGPVCGGSMSHGASSTHVHSHPRATHLPEAHAHLQSSGFGTRTPSAQHSPCTSRESLCTAAAFTPGQVETPLHPLYTCCAAELEVPLGSGEC